jgi:hypothetical protein
MTKKSFHAVGNGSLYRVADDIQFIDSTSAEPAPVNSKLMLTLNMTDGIRLLSHNRERQQC